MSNLFATKSMDSRRGAPLARTESGEGLKVGAAGARRHEVASEFEKPGGGYTGRILIDGEIYSTAEATRKFLQPSKRQGNQ